MADAQIAIYGQVAAVRVENGRRIYTVNVDHVFKGQVGETLELNGPETAQSSCDVVLTQGQRFGAFLGADLSLGGCRMATLQELQDGAQVFPAPTGRGRAVALLTGPFAGASFAAIDRRGRVIAYARSPGARGPVVVDPCRGGRFAIESSAGRLRVRRMSNLRSVARLPVRRARSITCLDRRGRVAVVARNGRILRVGRRARTIWRGRWRMVETGRFASAVVGTRGLLQLVDSRRGRVRTAVTTGRPRAMAFSPDGLRLAVLAGRRLTVYDFRARRLASQRVRAGRTQVLWTRGGRLLTLTQQTPNARVVGQELWWLTRGRLRRVSLRGGRATTLSTLPQRPDTRLVPIPERPPVRDRGLFSPPSPTSGGYQLPAGPAPAVAAAPR